jgi:hypothetical protein
LSSGIGWGATFCWCPPPKSWRSGRS